MTKIIAHNFDQVTKRYSGSNEVVRQKGQGLPAGSTATPPPERRDGFARVWDGEQWDYKEDHLGAEAYSKANGNRVEITELGAIPNDVTLSAPPPFGLWDGNSWVVDPKAQADDAIAQRNARIEAFMWRIQRYESQVRQGITPTDNIEALDTYVQYLRDLPEQEGFPANIQWPEEP